MKRNPVYSTHIGAASVLLIFLVLSLISFAALTLVNSRADYVLSKKMYERSVSYYKACHEANGFIAENEPGLRNGSHGKGDIKRSIPLSQFQTLDVCIRPSSEDSENSYEIAEWKVVTHTDDVILDESLPVLK
ncbi:hypothetical protein [Butyrivibrio sp. AC2005]|uniref:hypothetical protein n=1 Tax=Butyrivibrio sp. AC2005 TaxID=1280672 RepID=UPI0003FF4907|nr:hypothetical protein [Butyrivibrio sp. AC2005]